MPTATTATLRLAACTGLALLALSTTVTAARADGPGGAAAPGAGADPVGSITAPVATPVTVPAPAAVTGGASPTEAPTTAAASLPAATVAGPVARLAAGQGVAPADAPPEVALAVAAANAIVGLPYRWGGGHGSFDDRGYDCSGAVSYVLHAAGALDDPLDSGSLARWGERGRGRWVTVYANGGHAYVVIAGLRFDTSGTGGKGPRWRAASRPSRGFTPRHPAGL
jgi:cell wall-associated NlpC family hydrolase